MKVIQQGNHHGGCYSSRPNRVRRQFPVLPFGTGRADHRPGELHGGQADHRSGRFVDNRGSLHRRIFWEIRRQLDFGGNAFFICRDLFLRLHKLERRNRSLDPFRGRANHYDRGRSLHGRKTWDIGVVRIIDRHCWFDLFSVSRG